ncbi:MAG: hypothetical protein IKF53_00420 [Clostridia bacterium]|nr:hypothetical protein [Clostridia bacterium]
MKNNLKSIFLAANSAEGFVSFFGESYDVKDGWRAYIIKGGPGTGKSTIMKTVAKSAAAVGFDPVLVYCSSDPDSLDGVIINEKKAVIIDGTSPHIVEPSLYGAGEIIVNPGDLLDTALLEESREELINLGAKNKLYHETSSRYVAAAGEVFKDNLRLSASALDIYKIKRFVMKTIDKYFKQSPKGKRVKRAFLSGITSKGIVSHTDKAELWCDNIIVLEDKTRAAAYEIIRRISAAAKNAGYSVIEFKNPLHTEIGEHIVIEELSLGIFTESENIKLPKGIKRVHVRRFYQSEKLFRIKQKIKFNNRIYNSLIKTATDNLSLAKATHDEIEAVYIRAMNFKGTRQITDKLLKNIFDRKNK